MEYEIPDLVQAVLDNKAKKIKRYPCYQTRASSLGYFVPELDGCLRRGVYEITHWEQKELHSPEVQSIFDEGNSQEKLILRDLSEAGIELIETQSAFQYKNKEGEIVLTGTIDGKLPLGTEAGRAIKTIPAEIKSCAPNIFNGIHSLEDFHKKPWTQAYLAQITVYMLMYEVDTAIFILKNKSNGMLRQIVVKLDYNLGEACLKTAETIHKHVKAETLPDRIDNRQKCKDCPFKLVCLPEIDFGAPLKIADDPSLESKIDRYLELKDSAKESDNLWKNDITPTCKATAENGELNVMLGKYHISGKTASNGSFRTTIKLIGESDAE